jgi:hypothetical protein
MKTSLFLLVYFFVVTQVEGKKCTAVVRYSCPSNPSFCKSIQETCDGRIDPKCKNDCGGPFESTSFYDKKIKNCIKRYTYCGQRKNAKYKNNQCFSTTSRDLIDYKINKNHYLCLNRNDKSEGEIKETAIYTQSIQASMRKNLFKIFESNDTHISCGDQSLPKDCSKLQSKCGPIAIKCS